MVSRDPLMQFWDPSISETIEARNFKFGIELDDNFVSTICNYNKTTTGKL